MAHDSLPQKLQKTVWDARLPLEIRLAPSECRTFDQADPYLILWPRISYLPFLLPKLHAYFAQDFIEDPATIDPVNGHFTFDNVPLKWHLPIGLLYDTYVLAVQDPENKASQHQLPFRLTVQFANESSTSLINPSPQAMHDSYINAVKEADFIRSGTAKPIMTLPTTESKALWTSTQENDLVTFSRIHNMLLPKPGQFRNIPIRIFLPASSENDPASAQIRVLQSPIPPASAPAANTPNPQSARVPMGNQPQTVGTALHTLMPKLFPSKRTAVMARPLLHGAPIPMTAKVEELARWASYADGWVNIVVAING
jgi:autophagy-related protein 5